MAAQTEIDFRTDEEVKSFLDKRIEEMKVTARGDGFYPIQARLKLKAIEKLTESEKLEIGRQMFILGIE